MAHKQWFQPLLALGALLIPGSGFVSAAPPSYNFATPVFGLAAAPDGSLLVADYLAGVVELRNGQGHLVADLLAVSDVAPIGRGDLFAVTGKDPTGSIPTAQKLFRVSRGKTRQLADLFAFEQESNPDGGLIDSNPFDVAALTGGKALVADAGANDLLIVDAQGQIDWVATLPDELAPTQDVKNLVGCPTPAAGFEFVCGLPDAMPAQGVATSIAIGPDGAYYVGELKGFPAPKGMSRVWRIEPGARHAECGSSEACSVVAGGFTSIVDLAFGPDGTLYVVELDENTWAAIEWQLGGAGGTVNACDSSTWTCSEKATGLPIPMAVAVDKNGGLSAAILALVPGAADVIPLP
jgi:hypothetical protein